MRAFFQNELDNNQKKESFVSYKTVEGRFNLTKPLIRSMVILSLVALLCNICNSGWAGDFNIGGADGSFESDFTGMTTTGDVRLVPSFGSLNPTQGAQAAVLTTEPDEGSTLADVDISLLSIENFTIPVDTEELRLDYNFLTDELTPSFTNDLFSVKLLLITAGGEELLLGIDTFDTFFNAPWMGHSRQSGFRTMLADISAYAGSADLFTLELRLADVGDGRNNSAVFIDNMQFATAGEPYANSNIKYIKAATDEIITFDATGCTDDGTIVEFRGDFGDGEVRIGPIGDYA